MHDSTTLSLPFLEGFTEQCMALDFSPEESEALFKKFATLNLLQDDGLRAGLTEGLLKLGSVYAAHPDVIEAALDCRIRYSDDSYSRELREQCGLPEPSLENAPEHLQKIAASMTSQVDSFASLPLHQKMLLATLLGGGAGAAARAIDPSEEDKLYNRSAPSRALKGAVRGAGTGIGAAAGGAAGNAIGRGTMGAGGATPGTLIGALLGGLAGNNLSRDMVG